MGDMTTRRREIRDALARRSTEQIIAAVDAGHTMAQMPLTDEDKAALARVDRGKTTLEEERARMLAEFAAQRALNERSAANRCGGDVTME